MTVARGITWIDPIQYNVHWTKWRQKSVERGLKLVPWGWVLPLPRISARGFHHKPMKLSHLDSVEIDEMNTLCFEDKFTDVFESTRYLCIQIFPGGEGAPTYNFGHFSPKSAWNWKKIWEGGVHPLRHLKSSTARNDIHRGLFIDQRKHEHSLNLETVNCALYLKYFPLRFCAY